MDGKNRIYHKYRAILINLVKTLVYAPSEQRWKWAEIWKKSNSAKVSTLYTPHGFPLSVLPSVGFVLLYKAPCARECYAWIVLTKTCIWPDTFKDMKNNGQLDPLNCTVYIMSTNLKSTSALLSSRNARITTPILVKKLSQYLLTWSGNLVDWTKHYPPSPKATDVEIGDADEHVAVPRLSFPPCQVLLQQMHSIISLQPCCDNGIASGCRSATAYTLFCVLCSIPWYV